MSRLLGLRPVEIKTLESLISPCLSEPTLPWHAQSPLTYRPTFPIHRSAYHSSRLCIQMACRVCNERRRRAGPGGEHITEQQLAYFQRPDPFSPLPRNGDSIRGHDLVTYLALPASVASGRTRQTLSPRQMYNGFCNALDMDFHSMFCNGPYQ